MKKNIPNNASHFQVLISHLKSYLLDFNDNFIMHIKYPHQKDNAINFFRYISLDQSNIPLHMILDIDVELLDIFNLNMENLINAARSS